MHHGTAYKLTEKSGSLLLFHRWSEESVLWEAFVNTEATLLELNPTDGGYGEIVSRGDIAEFLGVFIPDGAFEKEFPAILIHIGTRNIEVGRKKLRRVIFSKKHYTEAEIIPEEMRRPWPHLKP